jgi:hypothetical protein
VDLGLEEGQKLRVDTTVIQTDIHHPTDNTLLWDVVRVVTRLVLCLAAAVHRGIQGFGNRTRAARRRMQEIQRMTSKERHERQAEKYRELIGVTEEVVNSARKVVEQTRKARAIILSCSWSVLEPADNRLEQQNHLKLVPGKALRDDWLGEYFVPAGTEIYVPPYFIQRHPNLWEEPDRFNPDRFRPENSKNRHRLATIPFSSGPRNCIGAHFARIEMQIHLLTIARYLRLRYIPSRRIEFDAGVNLRSKYDFIMYPEVKVVGSSEAAASDSDP